MADLAPRMYLERISGLQNDIARLDVTKRAVALGYRLTDDTSSVGFGWIGEYQRAKQARDTAAAERAATAVQGSHKWKVLHQMMDKGRLARGVSEDRRQGRRGSGPNRLRRGPGLRIRPGARNASTGPLRWAFARRAQSRANSEAGRPRPPRYVRCRAPRPLRVRSSRSAQKSLTRANDNSAIVTFIPLTLFRPRRITRGRNHSSTPVMRVTFRVSSSMHPGFVGDGRDAARRRHFSPFVLLCGYLPKRLTVWFAYRIASVKCADA